MNQKRRVEEKRPPAECRMRRQPARNPRHRDAEALISAPERGIDERPSSASADCKARTIAPPVQSRNTAPATLVLVVRKVRPHATRLEIRIGTFGHAPLTSISSRDRPRRRREARRFGRSPGPTASECVSASSVSLVVTTISLNSDCPRRVVGSQPRISSARSALVRLRVVERELLQPGSSGRAPPLRCRRGRRPSDRRHPLDHPHRGGAVGRRAVDVGRLVAGAVTFSGTRRRHAASV